MSLLRGFVERVRRTTLAPSALPVVIAAGVAVVVLGPALGRGVVLSYDLVWSPDPRWTPFTLGIGTPAPRAVPGDAATVALGTAVGASLAQALVLLGTLVLAGVGAARLAAPVLPVRRPMAAGVAALVGVWNPFVLERLVVGQWTVLLGYAATPHLLLLARRARSDPRAARLLAAGVVGVGVGGANTVLVALLAVVPVLVLPRPAGRALAWATAAAAGASAVWAVPALVAGVSSGAAGARAFSPRADTPLGVLPSLLSGGGFWNPATHPPERASWLVALVASSLAGAAVAAAVLGLRRVGAGVLAVPAALGAGLVVLSVADTGGLWTALVTSVPGGGLLRDSQKLLAPFVVLVAVGIGVLAARLASRRGVGVVAAVVLVALPVLTLPSLAWGVGGRLSAVQVPTDIRSAAARLSSLPAGTVGVLPWSQYRQYAWNGHRTSLTLVPRLVDQRVLVDDSLPLSTGRVPGEDPAAARVSAAIAAGRSPLEALESEGARYLVLERRVGPAGARDEVLTPPGAVVLADGPDLLLLDLHPGAAPRPAALGPLATVAWWVTLATAVAALVIAGHAGLTTISRRRGEGVTGW